MTEQEYRPLRIAEAWRQAGDDSLSAARACRLNGNWRSAISRSYYAAYAFLASVLASQGMAFREDRVGPEHEPLADLVRDQMRVRLGSNSIREIRSRINALREARLLADYRPHRKVDESSAKEAERLAGTVRKLIERELP